MLFVRNLDSSNNHCIYGLFVMKQQRIIYMVGRYPFKFIITQMRLLTVWQSTCNKAYCYDTDKQNVCK